MSVWGQPVDKYRRAVDRLRRQSRYARERGNKGVDRLPVVDDNNMAAPPAIFHIAGDDQRLAALYRFDVLDSEPESAFDDVVELAAEIGRTPMALINFVDRDRQWFKARRQFPIQQTRREYCFCVQVVSSGEALVVPDATEDARFRDLQVVCSGPGIRFYAGAPITTSDGHHLGTVCIMDHRPREFGPSKLAALQALARHVATLLEMRQATKRQQAQEQLQLLLAHDLRGPLGAASGFAEVLASSLAERATPAVRQALQSLQTGLDRSTSLLQSLLSWAAERDGHVTRQTLLMDLRALTDTAFEQAETAALLKRVRLCNEVDAGMTLTGDPRMLLSALRNLVFNAIRHTPVDGQVRVCGWQKADGAVELQVEDQGQGFERRADAGVPTAALHRFGLGLQLASDLVTRLHGRLQIHPDLGRGLVSLHFDAGRDAALLLATARISSRLN
ncbi:MAG: GAF domain-containing sensor histidine kinase [Xanthomonadales bacterium]|nr:GAF domain-containing sensor histidine kinase [Xanthomonadales bacterium]